MIRPVYLWFPLFALCSFVGCRHKQVDNKTPSPAVESKKPIQYIYETTEDVGSYKIRYQPPSLSYPPEANRLGIEGKVVLKLFIGKDGKVFKVDTISGPKELIPASVNYVNQFLFDPNPNALPPPSPNDPFLFTIVFKKPKRK